MAKQVIIFPTIAFFLFISITGSSQIYGIKGEGDIVKQEIKLESLRGINLGISGDVVLTQGSPQKIVVEGQQNIIDNIEREVKGGLWNIRFDKNVRESKNVTVYITLQDLEEISLTGSGSVRSTNKFAGLDDLDISVVGSGEITLVYEANTTDLNLSGSGSIDLAGTSDELSIAISGSGDVIAGDLKANDCEIQISGSGDARVNVNQTLSAQISGSGDVHYSGNASINSQISGSGEVTKINQ